MFAKVSAPNPEALTGFWHIEQSAMVIEQSHRTMFDQTRYTLFSSGYYCRQILLAKANFTLPKR